MSQQPREAIPAWDVADRMRKALRSSGVGVQEMADYLGVARNTVSTWINGRIEPSKQTVRLWALRTGVPYEWLETGSAPRPEPGGEERARRDSNPQPSDP
jgi:transcriptional regulator with XRE-family HTH domain